MNTIQPDYHFVLVIVGEQAVGKSSLMYRFVDNKFDFNIIGTTGLDIKTKILEENNQHIKVTIYDSAGHERFRSIASNQCKKSNGIILVYDVTDRKSFEGLTMWMKSIQQFIDKGVECLIIGNKIDLVDLRVVSTEEGLKMAESYHVSFIETSAKESMNVQEAFEKVVKRLYQKENDEEEKKNKEKNDNENNDKDGDKEGKKKKNKAGGCCYSTS